MTDWIDNLKKTERDESDAARKKEDLRLHDAAMIRAKAPEFWKTTIHFIHRDCTKLAEQFPGDRNLHCHVIGNPTNGIRCFSGGPLPNQVIDIDLNLDGQCLEIQEGTRVDRGDDFDEERSYQAEFSVGQEEQLIISFKGKFYESADSFAGSVIRHVCKIR